MNAEAVVVAGIRHQSGVLGWSIAIVAHLGWLLRPLLGIAGLPLWALAIIAAHGGWIGLLFLAFFLWRGPPGMLAHPKRWAVGVFAFFITAAVVWLGGVSDTYEADFLGLLVSMAALIGFAERAHAAGRPRLSEAIIGAAGTYPAAIAFFIPETWSLPIPAITAWLVLVGLQFLPLRTSTRWAIAVGTPVAAWSLDGFLPHGWLLVALEVFAVVAYVVALIAFLPRLPRPVNT